jgi:hypothetical protein
MRARGGQLLRFLQAEAEAEAERQVYSADHWVLDVVWCCVVLLFLFLLFTFIYLWLVVANSPCAAGLVL